MKFTKLPVTIEAVQWTGQNATEVGEFIGLLGDQIDELEARAGNTAAPSIIIDTLEGRMEARVGDWIIKGINGEFYPCKPDIFAKTYQQANGSEESHQARAVGAVLEERRRQNTKWGEQNHDPITWSAILTEECGEFAEAALHHRFGGPAADGLRNEAVQCAAVALQIVECIDRNAASKTT